MCNHSAVGAGGKNLMAGGVGLSPASFFSPLEYQMKKEAAPE